MEKHSVSAITRYGWKAERVVTTQDKFLILGGDRYGSGLTLVCDRTNPSLAGGVRPSICQELLDEYSLQCKPSEIYFGRLFTSKKGGQCFELMPTRLGPHILVRNDWHRHERPHMSRHSSCLFWSENRSNGGGIGTEYQVLPTVVRESANYDPEFDGPLNEEGPSLDFRPLIQTRIDEAIAESERRRQANEEQEVLFQQILSMVDGLPRNGGAGLPYVDVNRHGGGFHSLVSLAQIDFYLPVKQFHGDHRYYKMPGSGATRAAIEATLEEGKRAMDLIPSFQALAEEYDVAALNPVRHGLSFSTIVDRETQAFPLTQEGLADMAFTLEATRDRRPTPSSPPPAEEEKEEDSTPATLSNLQALMTSRRA